MRTLVILLIALGLTLTAAPRASLGITGTLTDDSYTRTGSAAKFGKLPTLKLSLNGSSVQRTWIKFDLSTLPSGTVGSDISKATLTLWVNKISTTGAFEVHRVTGSWDEETLNDATMPTIGGVEATVAVTPANVHSYVTADVTAVVRDWVDGVSPNDGIALVPAVTGTSVGFDSKENTTTSHGPQLEIALAAGPQGPQGPQGPPGGPLVIDANQKFVGLAYVEKGMEGSGQFSRVTALMNVPGIPQPVALALANNQGTVPVPGPTGALYYQSNDCSGPAFIFDLTVGESSSSFMVLPGLLNGTTIYYPTGTSSLQGAMRSWSLLNYGCHGDNIDPSLAVFSTATIDLSTLGLTLPFHVQMPTGP